MIYDVCGQFSLQRISQHIRKLELQFVRPLTYVFALHMTHANNYVILMYYTNYNYINVYLTHLYLRKYIINSLTYGGIL